MFNKDKNLFSFWLMTKVCKLVLFHVYGRHALMQLYFVEPYLCVLNPHLFFGMALIHSFGFGLPDLHLSHKTSFLQTTQDNSRHLTITQLRKTYSKLRAIVIILLLLFGFGCKEKLFPKPYLLCFRIKNGRTALKYVGICSELIKCLSKFSD